MALAKGKQKLGFEMLPEDFIGKTIKVGQTTIVVNQVGQITVNSMDQVGYYFISSNPQDPQIELNFGDIFEVL